MHSLWCLYRFSFTIIFPKTNHIVPQLHIARTRTHGIAFLETPDSRLRWPGSQITYTIEIRQHDYTAWLAVKLVPSPTLTFAASLAWLGCNFVTARHTEF